MSLVCLTKSNRNVLVNPSQVTQIESVKTREGQVLSKIFLINGTYCLVEESLQEIYDLVNNNIEKEIDWTKTSVHEFLQHETNRYQKKQFISQEDYDY